MFATSLFGLFIMRTLLLAMLVVGTTFAQKDNIQRGTVKQIDLNRLRITITIDGKDRELHITEDTRVFGAEGKKLLDRFNEIKEGSAVMFLPSRKDDRDTLMALRSVESIVAPKLPKVDLTKLKPLTELGKAEYQGFAGGLYPNGANTRPEAHEKEGLARAKNVQPRDRDGQPAANGKIVLLSVGMSNTSQASYGFAQHLRNDENKNPALVFVNGAQGGMTAKAIQDPKDNATGTRYWTTVDDRLKSSNVSAAQVQAIWIKQADAGPTQGFPKYAQTLQAELANIVRVCAERYPNLQMIYLSSRTFGGYAKTPLNPEPYAYESGFAVKWLIEDHLKGPIKGPWLSWGPYLWANGSTKRADGFAYDEADFADDGTHQSPTGQLKVGKELLKFFQTDPTSKPWFVQEK